MEKNKTQKKTEFMPLKKGKWGEQGGKKEFHSLSLTFDPGFKSFKVSTAQMEFKS